MTRRRTSSDISIYEDGDRVLVINTISTDYSLIFFVGVEVVF